MSRTLKDRPYWVKLNDKSLPLIAHHDHDKAGQPVYRYLPVKDENGKNVMETYTYKGVLGYSYYNFYERRSILYPTWEEFVAAVPENYIFFSDRRYHAQYGDVEKTRVKHEKVIIGYKPTECTIDDYEPRTNRYYDNDVTHLCYHTLKYYAGGYRYCDHRPSDDERKDYQRKSRRNENVALHKLKGAANAGYDYEDDLYEDVFAQRSKRHRGWWC